MARKLDRLVRRLAHLLGVGNRFKGHGVERGSLRETIWRPFSVRPLAAEEASRLQGEAG